MNLQSRGRKLKAICLYFLIIPSLFKRSEIIYGQIYFQDSALANE